MDEFTNESTNESGSESAKESGSEFTRPVRRRRPSQAQVFKENYLPIIFIAAALIMIIIFIVGAVGRSNAQKAEKARQESIAKEESARQASLLEAEVVDILNRSEALALQYDYVGAIKVIDSFSGDAAAYPELAVKRDKYAKAYSEMTEWGSLDQVTHLSFHLLIADPQRAWNNAEYGDSYNRNFVTCEEFSKILQQLYDNGYMLVDYNDFVEVTQDADGNNVYTAKKLYLPAGKKPLMITETQVNYYQYMTDSDGDGSPDKDAAGFASRLLVDENGQFTCELVDSSGTTVTGNYDLVPILESFIQEHSDFSFGGARAVLAVSGYDGIFGYRIDSDGRDKGSDYYNQQVEGAQRVVNALRDRGYILACYTYGNESYGEFNASEIQADLDKWNSEIVPVLGETDVLVYARNSDIGDTYSGAAYEVLKQAGFHYYLSFCQTSAPWANITSEYVRQGRLLVTGQTMREHTDYFQGMFDPLTVLDTSRPALDD